jgi:hypothetical protein
MELPKHAVCHTTCCVLCLSQVPGCTADLQADGQPYCMKKRKCTQQGSNARSNSITLPASLEKPLPQDLPLTAVQSASTLLLIKSWLFKVVSVC